jgi:hypothetical protein
MPASEMRYGAQQSERVPHAAGYLTAGQSLVTDPK